MSDEEPRRIAIDEEADHQIVPGDRFGKANGAAHQPFDPGPQLDGLACDCVRIRLAHVMRRWGDRPLVRPPSIGVKPCDTTRRSARLSFEADGSLPPAKAIRYHGATGVVDCLP